MGRSKLDAAILADYVAEANDPFNTTENFDGHLTNQTGINERFGITLVARYSSFFPMRPNDASFISDPTDHAFESCLNAHSWLETILLADRNARLAGKSYDRRILRPFLQSGRRHFDPPTLRRRNGHRLLLANRLDQRRPPATPSLSSINDESFRRHDA